MDTNIDQQKTVDATTPATTPVAEPVRQKRRGGNRPPARQNRRSDRPSEEFEQRIVDLARVTRVMAGGKRMKFRACIIIGDKNGRVSMGLAKGADVSQAIGKAVAQAKKSIQSVPIIDGTIPHQVTVKVKSAKIMIKPAKRGSGIKAGGVVRTVLELAGIKDVTAKILGANNKINNSRATLVALASFVPRARAQAQAHKAKAQAPRPVIKHSDRPLAPAPHVAAKS